MDTNENAIPTEPEFDGEAEEVESNNIQVTIHPDAKGYWEKETNSRTRPMWTYLALAVQQEPMEIISRSRNGDYMVSFCC